MQRIGIFGGTFNPVHKEHINLAINAVKELKLDKLFIMPTFISPHKSHLSAPAEDRVNMLKLAFFGQKNVEISDFEIKKGGKSYTYQTVEYFKSQFDCELFFICGADMLVDFKTWKEPQRILNSATLCVFSREDFLIDYDKEKKYFIENFKKEFIKLSYVGKRDSSTKIRIFASLNLPLTDFTTKKVEKYILTNKIYGEFKYAEFLKNNLTEKRIIHTANVAVTALSKVKELNLDYEKVKTSALLHDLAKYISPFQYEGEIIEQVNQSGVEISSIEEMPKAVIHAFLGAIIAENALKIQDQDVLNAIRYHTTARPNMSALEKLIFVADMVEEGRNYQGVETLRKYYSMDFETCFKECLKEEMIHLKNKNQEIFKLTEFAYNYYIK